MLISFGCSYPRPTCTVKGDKESPNPAGIILRSRARVGIGFEDMGVRVRVVQDMDLKNPVLDRGLGLG